LQLTAWILVLTAVAVCLAVWRWRAERSRREAADRQARRWKAEAARISEDVERVNLRYDLLADSSSDLLFIVDRDLRLTYANAAAESVFGSWESGPTIIRYTQSQVLEEQARQALESGEAESERIITLQDRPFRCRVRARADVVGLALIDTTEVQRLTRARQDMVANLSHELRTPLTSLALLAETLLARQGDPDLTRDLARKILAEVDTLNQMSQEMLDLAAIESGRQVVRLVPVPLRDVVVVPVERLAEQAQRRQVLLVDDTSDGLTVLADRDQAARAVQNVLHNAVKFTPPGGRVRITADAEADGQHVLIHVWDEGPGIAPADLARVFERFFRGDQARGTPGTGLGLAITRHIMRAHGGEAWAENQPPPGGGAIIHLRFLAG
jgi:two-component system phosphate regulon sensor histidine kinase PhoR